MPDDKYYKLMDEALTDGFSLVWARYKDGKQLPMFEEYAPLGIALFKARLGNLDRGGIMVLEEE